MEAPTGPRIVGRYALFDAIASGGMASVHVGRLLGPVGFSRTVAIKRLHENFARDPEFVAMLVDEARIVARIRHPNVVPTLDVVTVDGELLLVMEYIIGESFSRVLKRAHAAGKPPPIPVVVDIMIGVLHGLHAAHEAKTETGEPLCIVHRDVSPQNILLGTDGMALVHDFGIAKAVGRMQQTRQGQVKGRLHYMPPEQLRSAGVTRTVDVYAASVVLAEALTGKNPFLCEDDVSTMYEVLHGTPPAPSASRPDVPPALDEIVLRGMQKNAADRYPTAKAMASALEAVVPPVPRSAVAAWIMESAGEDLQHRERYVAEVEGNLTLMPMPAGSAPRPAFASVPTSITVRDLTPEPLSSTSRVFADTTVKALPRRFARERRIGMIALAGAAVLAGSLLFLFWGRSGSAPLDTPSATAPARPTASLLPPSLLPPSLLPPSLLPPSAAAPAETTSATAAAAAPVSSIASAAPAALSASAAPAALSASASASAAAGPPKPKALPNPDRIYKRD